MKHKAPSGLLPALALIFALILSACAGSGGESAEPPSQPPAGSATGSAPAPASSPASGGAALEVTGNEYSFDPVELSAPADTDVSLTLRNEGGLEHDWSIQGQDVRIVAEPGQTGTGTFNLPPGTYAFYCSIPGHEAAGMQGTLKVG